MSVDSGGGFTDDQRMAEALRDAGRHVFAYLYESFAARLFDYCEGVLRDSAAAAAVVQDSLVAVDVQIGQLPDADRLRVSLYSVAHIQCLSKLPGRRRNLSGRPETTTLDEFLGEQAGGVNRGGPAAGAAAAERERLLILTAALDSLADRDREVMDLAFRHGIEDADLAAVLGVPHRRALALLASASTQFLKSANVIAVLRSGSAGCQALRAIAAAPLLTPKVRDRLAQHIESCPACTARQADQVFVPEQLSDVPFSVPPVNLGMRISRTVIALGSHRGDDVLAGSPDTGAVPVGQPDAGALSAGRPDAGALSAGRPDAGALSAGQPDAGALSAGRPDAAAVPVGQPDAGGVSVGQPDAGALSAGRPDAAALSAGQPDAGAVPAGQPDAEPVSVVKPDTGAVLAGSPHAEPVLAGPPDAEPVPIELKAWRRVPRKVVVSSLVVLILIVPGSLLYRLTSRSAGRAEAAEVAHTQSPTSAGSPLISPELASPMIAPKGRGRRHHLGPLLPGLIGPTPLGVLPVLSPHKTTSPSPKPTHSKSPSPTPTHHSASPSPKPPPTTPAPTTPPPTTPPPTTPPPTTPPPTPTPTAS